ncbi:MAG: hypothetical protein ACR2GY_05260 [Phycisphaerales bacterium]
MPQLQSSNSILFPAVLLLMLSLFGPCGVVQAQRDIQDDEATTPPAASQEATDPAVNETQAAIWLVHVTALMDRERVQDPQRANVIELYIASRTNHVAAEKELVEEWHASIAQHLEEGGGTEVFDVSELAYQKRHLRVLMRSTFARKLVEIVDQPLAERIYPSLALFDPKADGMIGSAVKFELDATALSRAVTAIEKLFITRERAAEIARQTRRKRTDVAREAVETFESEMSRILTNERDLDRFLKDVGIRRRGRGDF